MVSPYPKLDKKSIRRKKLSLLYKEQFSNRVPFNENLSGHSPNEPIKLGAAAAQTAKKKKKRCKQVTIVHLRVVARPTPGTELTGMRTTFGAHRFIMASGAECR